MKSMLITGGSGFIGSNIVPLFSRSFKLYKTDKNFINESNLEDCIFLDITNAHLVNRVLSEYKTDIVLHLAANKDVGFCEINPDEARRINVDGTKNVLDACGEIGAFMIFLSSDYVFEGSTGMYAEEDIRCPSTVYGKMKKEAEDLVMGSGVEYCICRSGGVYGYPDRQSSLLNWATEKLKKGEEIPAFINVFNTPTCVLDLSMGIELIAKEQREGIFHIVGCQRVSRWEFLREYALSYGFDPSLVVEEEYEDTSTLNSYKRPADLSLSAKFSETMLGMGFLSIRDGFEILRRFER